jgi:hypothetical protein
MHYKQNGHQSLTIICAVTDDYYTKRLVFRLFAAAAEQFCQQPPQQWYFHTTQASHI